MSGTFNFLFILILSFSSILAHATTTGGGCCERGAKSVVLEWNVGSQNLCRVKECNYTFQSQCRSKHEWKETLLPGWYCEKKVDKGDYEDGSDDDALIFEGNL